MLNYALLCRQIEAADNQNRKRFIHVDSWGCMWLVERREVEIIYEPVFVCLWEVVGEIRDHHPKR